MAAPNVQLYMNFAATPGNHTTASQNYITITSQNSILVFAGRTFTNDTPMFHTRPSMPITCDRVYRLFAMNNNIYTECLSYKYYSEGIFKRRMFAVRFWDYACSRRPELRAWNGNGLFNRADSALFNGTVNTSFLPLIRAINADTVAPPIGWWFATSMSRGNVDAVALRGDESYLSQLVSGGGYWDSPNGEWDFHLVLLMPSDGAISPSDLDIDLQLVYYYS